jgi:hypothetical protein
MPEFTRDELSEIDTLLAEYDDILRGVPLTHTVVTSPEETREKTRKQIKALRDKIMGICYPPG